MTRFKGHRVLFVEDNADERDELVALLESLGESVRVEDTVEKGLAALEEEEFCVHVFDQALPVDEDADAKVTGGERLVRAARAIDRRCTADGAHVTPTIAFTSYSEKAKFVTGLFAVGISTFVSKPLSENTEYFLEQYRAVLARAGRDDHAKCGALSQGQSHAAKDETRSTEDIGPAHVGGIAAQLGAKTFADVAFRLVDGHTMRISCQRRRVHATYIDLGFAGRTRQPLKEWTIFQTVCEGHGVLRAKTCGNANNARQRVFVLSRALKAAMGLADEPLRRAHEVAGWRANFFASSDFGRDDI